MRPRMVRRLPRRQHAPKPVRTFTYNSAALHNSRPQLPFLSTPSARQQLFRRQQWRYLTTERKQWLKGEAILSVKYTAYIWVFVFCFAAGGFAIQQEFMERGYPTPHEWSFNTRMLKRGAEAEKMRTDVIMENWPLIIQMLKDVLDRLEDEKGDGKGIKSLGSNSPPGAKDISAMPESWRRGYYEALLLYCQASEHVEGWVLDKKRKTVFPPDLVRGPSNPNPKPIPPGAKAAPREEDCISAGFPVPDDCYLKLLATEGLTTKQRMDAALAYANWLEHKGALGPAAIMLEDALNMAIEQMTSIAPDSQPVLDPKTMALINKAGFLPSENLLKCLTGVATFKARHEDVSAALPILISILQARRSLPSKQKPDRDAEVRAFYAHNKGNVQKVIDFFSEAPYPPPPPDGSAPPIRDSKELCEEAALDLHIGEIMFTMQPSTREQGWAWTREGVDLAEEQLHKVLEERKKESQDAKKTCRECLASGLSNWATMVRMMAREEEEEAKAKAGGKSTAGWFGLWTGEAVKENVGRWAAEEQLCEERTRRAQTILEDLEKPASGLMKSLVKV